MPTATELEALAHTAFLAARRLVHLRRGEFNETIRDYDRVLKLNPKQAWSLFERGGVAKRHLADELGGAADITAAAAAINPPIVEEASRRGVDPSNLKPIT